MADGLWTMARHTLGADFNPWGGHSPLPWIASHFDRLSNILAMTQSDSNLEI